MKVRASGVADCLPKNSQGCHVVTEQEQAKACECVAHGWLFLGKQWAHRCSEVVKVANTDQAKSYEAEKVPN